MLNKFKILCQKKYFFGKAVLTHMQQINKGLKTKTEILCFNKTDLNLQKNLSCFGGKPNHFVNYCETKKTYDKIQQEKIKSTGIPTTYHQKLVNAIKDYGIVILVFHSTVSLISLGCCYIIVLSGATDLELFKHWGIEEGAATAGIAAAFVLAYAIHKSTTPFRIALTLSVAPFMVKKLRLLGYLKILKNK